MPEENIEIVVRRKRGKGCKKILSTFNELNLCLQWIDLISYPNFYARVKIIFI